MALFRELCLAGMGMNTCISSNRLLVPRCRGGLTYSYAIVAILAGDTLDLVNLAR